jgi:hypothetical protein
MMMSNPYGKYKEGANYKAEQNFIREYYFNKFIKYFYLFSDGSIFIFLTMKFLF